MATRLSGSLLTNPAAVRSSSSTQEAPLGAYIESPNGMGFRYVLNGGTAMVPGNVYQAPSEYTNHQALTPTAAAIGATSVTVTLGATATHADEYKGGLLIVTSNKAEGETYEISGHPAAAASASLTVNLVIPLVSAIDANSRVDLVKNPYANVEVSPTTATSQVVGVALHAVVASEYGWVQTKGIASVRAGAAIAVGAALVRSTVTAGAAENATTIVGDSTIGKLGVALTGIAASEFGAALLNI